MLKLLMGNEAAGIAALKAGVNVICGYPGTPSTETLETAAKYNDGSVYIEWSVNEKAAVEVGAGAAYAGARVMVTMKQVGLNAATDPLMSLAYIGIKGGMVLYIADDPGPISSQTEQDTRRFAGYSKLPVFDPSTPEELYDMIGDAFVLSEKIGKPVIVRPTTRICHACASIDVPEKKAGHKIEGFKKSPEWVIFPKLSYQSHIKLEELAVQLSEINSGSRYNTVSAGVNNGLAVIASGAAYCNVAETAERFGLDIKIIKLGCAVPAPEHLITEAMEGIKRVIVAEELDPVIEDSLYIIKAKYGLDIEIYGKRTGSLPYAGEYNGEIIKNTLCAFCGVTPEISPVPVGMPVRPPVLCAGCPHRASFYAVKKAMKGIPSVFSGDIGCYTLGNAQPLNMVDTCLCMGAGITIAQGLYHTEPGVKHFAFIGDSTFFHSGITGIINAVYNQADINVVILDNATTAMTGHQPHPGTGRTMMNTNVRPADIEALVHACGVEKLYTLDPFDLDKAVETVLEAADYRGVSVILFRSPCIVINKTKKPPLTVTGACTGCRRCINEIGCPAMEIKDGRAEIDSGLCTGCGLCTGICKFGAIK